MNGSSLRTKMPAHCVCGESIYVCGIVSRCWLQVAAGMLYNLHKNRCCQVSGMENEEQTALMTLFPHTAGLQVKSRVTCHAMTQLLGYQDEFNSGSGTRVPNNANKSKQRNC